MAWTAPRTWVTSEVVTSSLMNTHVRDNLLSLNVVGQIVAYGGINAPADWLACDGNAINRTTYSALYAALVRSKGTITMTIATPAVVSLTAHGLAIGDAVFFTTTGAFPTGITPDTTTYYIIAAGFTANSFQIAASRGGAAINTSGSQSGTHTMWHAPYGVSASTTFLLPDLRGRMVIGYSPPGAGGHEDVTILGAGEAGAQATSAVLANRRARHSHTHSLNVAAGNVGGSNAHMLQFQGWQNQQSSRGVEGAIGQGTAPVDAPASLVANWIIRAA